MGGIWVTLRRGWDRRAMVIGSGRGLPPRGKICPRRRRTHALAGGLHIRRALGRSSDQQSALAQKRVLQPRNKGLPALDHYAQHPGKGLRGLGPWVEPSNLTSTPTLISCHRLLCHPEVTRTLRARPAPNGVDSVGHAGPWQGLSPAWPWCPVDGESVMSP